MPGVFICSSAAAAAASCAPPEHPRSPTVRVDGRQPGPGETLAPHELLTLCRDSGGLAAMQWLRKCITSTLRGTRCRIDLQDPRFAANVGSVPGAVPFLAQCGWRRHPRGRYLTAPSVPPSQVGRHRELLLRRLAELDAALLADPGSLSIGVFAVHAAAAEGGDVFVRFELSSAEGEEVARWCSLACPSTPDGRIEWEPLRYATGHGGSCTLRLSVHRRRFLRPDVCLGCASVRFHNTGVLRDYVEVRDGDRPAGAVLIEIDSLALKMRRAGTRPQKAEREPSGAQETDPSPWEGSRGTSPVVHRPEAVVPPLVLPAAPPTRARPLSDVAFQDELPSPGARTYDVVDSEGYFGELRLSTARGWESYRGMRDGSSVPNAMRDGSSVPNAMREGSNVMREGSNAMREGSSVPNAMREGSSVPHARRHSSARLTPRDLSSAGSPLCSLKVNTAAARAERQSTPGGFKRTPAPHQASPAVRRSRSTA